MLLGDVKDNVVLTDDKHVVHNGWNRDVILMQHWDFHLAAPSLSSLTIPPSSSMR